MDSIIAEFYPINDVDGIKNNTLDKDLKSNVIMLIQTSGQFELTLYECVRCDVIINFSFLKWAFPIWAASASLMTFNNLLGLVQVLEHMRDVVLYYFPYFFPRLCCRASNGSIHHLWPLTWPPEGFCCCLLWPPEGLRLHRRRPDQPLPFTLTSWSLPELTSAHLS